MSMHATPARIASLPSGLSGLAAALLLTWGLALTLVAAAPATAVAASMTTTVNEAGWHSETGSVYFTSPQGFFLLDYEAGVDANKAAQAYLERIAGSAETISFSYFTAKIGGVDYRILTKSAVASLASRGGWR